VRQLANSAGEITLTQSYAPYDEVMSSTGAGSTNYAFTGEMRDPSGLTYLRARYLDSGIGRFISRDTWSGDYNRPLSLNRWGYVEGNPVNKIDPTGHYATSSAGNVAVPVQPSAQAQIYSILAQTKSQEALSSAIGCSEIISKDDFKFSSFKITLTPAQSTDLLIELNYWIAKFQTGSDVIDYAPFLEMAGATTIIGLVFAPAEALAVIAGGTSIALWFTEKFLGNTISDLSELRYQVAIYSGAQYSESENIAVAHKTMTLELGSNWTSWGININDKRVINRSTLFPLSKGRFSIAPHWLMLWYYYDL